MPCWTSWTAWWSARRRSSCRTSRRIGRSFRCSTPTSASRGPGSTSSSSPRSSGWSCTACPSISRRRGLIWRWNIGRRPCACSTCWIGSAGNSTARSTWARRARSRRRFCGRTGRRPKPARRCRRRSRRLRRTGSCASWPTRARRSNRCSSGCSSRRRRRNTTVR